VPATPRLFRPEHKKIDRTSNGVSIQQGLFWYGISLNTEELLENLFMLFIDMAPKEKKIRRRYVIDSRFSVSFFEYRIQQHHSQFPWAKKNQSSHQL
jgi:hypothetical protein